MHLMPLARSILRKFFVTVACSMLFTFAAIALAQRLPEVLDLTQPHSVGQNQRVRVPGYVVGAIGSKRLGPALRGLSLQLKIVSWVITSDGKIDLTVDIENSGAIALALPVSRDPATHEDGKRSRRTASFHVLVEGAGLDAVSDRIVASTYSSASDSRSYVTLAPSESRQVRLRSDLPPPNKLDAPLKLSVGYSEWEVADDQYQVVAESGLVKSADITIPLAGRR